MVQFSPRALTTVLLLFGLVLAHVASMPISSNPNTLRKKNCQQISSLAPMLSPEKAKLRFRVPQSSPPALLSALLRLPARSRGRGNEATRRVLIRLVGEAH